MKETELAYAAGIVDGEGYIGVKKSKAYECQGRSTPGYHALVAVKMIDRSALELLHRLFGGSFYAAKVNLDSPRRPLFAWQVSDAGAERVLLSLLPFMRVKKTQAKNVLALRRLQATGSKHRTKVVGERNFPNQHGTVRRVKNRAFSDAYVARCDAHWSKAKALNHAPGWAP